MTVVSTTVKRVGIVGSGIMGSGLVEVAARSGHEVVLRSRDQATADATVGALARSLSKLVDKGKLSDADRRATLGRVTATSVLADLRDCELVIESVVEDLAVKKRLFAELDEVCKKEAILATNTSTLPIMQMAVETGRPDQVCGIHFFNPATVMTLVEIIRPLTASDATIATAKAFAEDCGKEAVVAKDRAGFIVNALLFPYLNNAARMLEHGTASLADIETAMKGGCNFPMGPFTLLDLVGLDTSVAILDALYEEFRDPNYEAVPLLRRMVADGLTGRKAGQGFYAYQR